VRNIVIHEGSDQEALSIARLGRLVTVGAVKATGGAAGIKSVASLA
jgi:hypothetical protein